MKDYLDSLGLRLEASRPEHIPDDHIHNDLLWERIQNDKNEANTLLDGDHVISLGGYQVVNPYTAEIWSIPVDESYGKSIFKVAKWLLDNVYTVRFQRCQSVVDAENERNQRWNERLGFEKEAVLKGFHENDHLLYRRLD